MKPLDLQVNILQMGNAARKVEEKKEKEKNLRYHASNVTRRQSQKNSRSVGVLDHVEAIIPLNRHEELVKNLKSLEKHAKKNSEETEKKKEAYFSKNEPDKGTLFDELV